MDVVGTYGLYCASHPVEILISTLTLCIYLLSTNLGSEVQSPCSSTRFHCIETKDEAIFGDILMTFAQSLSICYIYFQFRYLKKKHSKYVIGLAAIFTILCTLMFGSVVIHFFHKDLIGIHNVLPVFLLMVDLSKSSQLTCFAIAADSEVKLAENISYGLKAMAPSVTLDAVVVALAFALGSQSGVHQLELMCSFACLAIITNYIVFMMVFPACLALVLELCNRGVAGDPVWQQGKQIELIAEQQISIANPVQQKVKLVMSVGLAVVHAHRFTSSDQVDDRNNNTFFIPSNSEDLQRHVPLWHLYIMRGVSVNVDQVFTFVLALALMAKFFFVDTADKKRIRFVSTSEHSNDDVDGSIINFYNMKEMTDQETQTGNKELKKTIFQIGDDNSQNEDDEEEKKQDVLQKPRTLTECVDMLNDPNIDPEQLCNEDVMQLVYTKHIPSYKMEDVLQNHERGVYIRRKMLTQELQDESVLESLPYKGYKYSLVHGACCENVIGFTSIPVGTAGPLYLDGNQYMVPMATTEGTLVASANRGCRALMASGGVISMIYKDGMTRAPVVQLPSIHDVSKVKRWLDDLSNFELLKQAFDSTSRFAKLMSIHQFIVGRNMYLRFLASTGDAMGMNMVTKGTEKALDLLLEIFPGMVIVSLSGNLCTDKKPAAINWIEGRGKSVTCEATIPGDVVKKVLKATTSALVNLNMKKNLIGSALAASVGGCNGHAANIVTAIFIATGQDVAQNITSSNCLTVMESIGENGEDLYMSCTMPSIEVGTIGGGTVLPAQQSCLQMLNVCGPCMQEPGRNASQLAKIVCATVLAGELSLLSALAAGHLVKSHMKHNRSSKNVAAGDVSMPKISIELSIKNTSETNINHAM